MRQVEHFRSLFQSHFQVRSKSPPARSASFCVHPPGNNNDLHETATKTTDLIKSIADKHAPIGQLSQKKQKLCGKLWITNGILKSIKTKHKLYKTHFLSNNPIKVTEYKKYANKLNWLKNICKKNYFSQHFDLCKNNLKASWKLIGMLVKRNSKGQTHISKIKRNNSAYTNKAEIADQFNTFNIYL